MPGFVAGADGALTLEATDDAANYGVVDEIVRRVLLARGRVLAARSADIPGDGPAAAILRYPVYDALRLQTPLKAEPIRVLPQHDGRPLPVPLDGQPMHCRADATRQSAMADDATAGPHRHRTPGERLRGGATLGKFGLSPRVARPKRGPGEVAFFDGLAPPATSLASS